MLSPVSVAEKTVTLGALLQWDRNRANIAPATRRMEEANARPLLKFFNENRPVWSIGPADVQNYIKQRLDIEGKKPRTVNMELQLLAGAFKRAAKNRMLSRVPFQIEKVPEPHTDRRALSRSEVERLLLEAEARGIGDEVAILANCALRRGELFRLKWADVDLDTNSLWVESRKRGGAGTMRRETIPLSPAAADVFAKRAERLHNGEPDPEALVFGVSPESRDDRLAYRRKGAKGTVEGVVRLEQHRFRHKLKAAARAAKIEWADALRPHDLRHYAATWLLANGTSIADTAKLLRHRTPVTTLKTYAHAMDESLRSAVERLGVALPAKVIAVQDVLRDGNEVSQDSTQSVERTQVTG